MRRIALFFLAALCCLDARASLADCTPAPPPAIIETACDLQNIGYDSTSLAGNYTLGGDIDATETATWNNGAGFVPIGVGASNTSFFTGTLDGHGHTIFNLTIAPSPSGGFVGLFGGLSGTAVIENLALGNVTIRTTSGEVGAIAGEMEGAVIVESFATGSITDFSSNAEVGGLVGYADGGSILLSYSLVTVAGGSNSILGGLVGVGDGQVQVNDSFAAGGITAEEHSQIGGLIGYDGDSSVSRSFALGPVQGNVGSDIGGLAGYASSFSSSIGSSYALGNAGGTDSGAIGGLVGYSYDLGAAEVYSVGRVFDPAGASIGGLAGAGSGSFSDSYWDTATSGQTGSAGAADCSASTYCGMSTADLKSALPPGFDATNWSIVPGVTYPILGPIMNDPLFMIPVVHSTKHSFPTRFVTFQPQFGLATISGAPYTVIPAGQLQPWQYYDYAADLAHVVDVDAKTGQKFYVPDEACLGVIHAMLVRMAGQADPTRSLSCANDAKSLMCSSVVNPPAGFSEPWSSAHLEWFLDSQDFAIWPQQFRALYPVEGPFVISDTAIESAIASGYPVLLHGGATGSGFGHWMLATSMLKDPSSGAVTRLVATDPWLGQQVLIDMAQDSGYHYAVMNPSGAGDPTTYESLAFINYRIFPDSTKKKSAFYFVKFH